MTESGMALGRNLQALRKARNMTLKEVDSSSGPRIESGEDVDMKLVVRYLKAMSIALEFKVKFRGTYTPHTDRPFLEVIRYAMVAKKLKVAQVANLLDMSYDKFFRLHGGYRPIRFKDCEKIFKLLGITTKFI
jgi:transcriptional regulator with XRE-family HTH domain